MKDMKMLEAQILDELEYSDLSAEMLKRRVQHSVVMVLKDMKERGLVENYNNKITGEELWRKK